MDVEGYLSVYSYLRSCRGLDTRLVQCVPHESNYEVKKRGEIPEEPSMFIAEGLELPKDKDIYIIDNVISSGATARAALKAVPNAIVVALARG